MIFAALGKVAVAQATASITGTVHDSTGAIVPSANVTVVNLGTGQKRTLHTDSAGDYIVTNLDIGDYKVTIEKEGFKQFARFPVTLEVDQRARIDGKLEPGSAEMVVTVTGSAPLIDSEKSDVGQVIDNATIEELPLDGRNFLQLGSLVAGGTEGAPGNTIISSRQEGQVVTVNGQRGEDNNYMLDGVDNNEQNIGLVTIIPSADAIQEFKVQTANYSAEFGRGVGAIVQVSTKAGTNKYHGSAYEYVRNQMFDAAGPFSTSPDPLKRNQFGFTVGGPITIPHVYSGKNRSFFFYGAEWLRQRQGITSTYTVPTELIRTGSFVGRGTIYDPTNIVGGKRQPFPGNVIPANRLNPIALKIMEYFPHPTNSANSNNYVINKVNSTNTFKQTLRIDQQLGERNSLFLRLSYSNGDSYTPAMPYNGIYLLNHPRGFGFGYTRIITANAVNELRIGAQRYRFDDNPDSLGTDWPTALGLPKYNAELKNLQFPAIVISGISDLSNNTNLPVTRAENLVQYADTLHMTVGRHTLAVGGDYIAYQYNNSQPQYISGNYQFTGAFTGAASAYGIGLGDFLLGLPAKQDLLNGSGYTPNYMRNKSVHLFIQDDWRVLPSVTLNMGLRWDRDGAWRDINDRWAYFDQSTGQLVYPKNAKMQVNTFPWPFRYEDTRDIKRAQNLGLSPRFGFAWRPFNNGSTVIRGAYGLFWGPGTDQAASNTASPPPFNLRQSLSSGNTTPELQFGVFPAASASSLLPTTPPTFIVIDPRSFQDAYIQQWNGGFEKQFLHDYALRVLYVGSKGTHLNRRHEINAALPGPGALQARRPYPLFGPIEQTDSEGWTSYNSLQVTLRKRMSYGLDMNVAYTYSKSLDVTDGWGGLSNETTLPQDPNNIAADYGPSSTDMRHRLTASVIYKLPSVSRNRHLLYAVVGGWQLSSLFTAHTGFPFTVKASGDPANIGQYAASERGSIVPGISPHLDNPSRAKWFNTAAFAVPALYTFGTASRNSLNGPNTVKLDVGLSKTFILYKENRLQFRAEYFNVPNHPILGLPNAVVGTGTFGTITTAPLIASRIGQLALKYTF